MTVDELTAENARLRGALARRGLVAWEAHVRELTTDVTRLEEVVTELRDLIALSRAMVWRHSPTCKAKLACGTFEQPFVDDPRCSCYVGALYRFEQTGSVATAGNPPEQWSTGRPR